MEPANRSAAGCSRRWFLTVLAASPLAAEGPAKGKLIPSVLKQFPDPATEFPVFQLTDPQFTSRLPSPDCRAFSLHGESLLYTSDLTGRFELFEMDLRSGNSRQLTEDSEFDPAAFTFLPGYRTVCYLDGDRLLEVNSLTLKVREMYHAASGFTLHGGLSVSGDGQSAVLVERSAQDATPAHYRLRLIHLGNGATSGTASTITESDEEILNPIPRPRRASAMYRKGADFWLVNFDGKQDRKLKLAAGETLQAMWSPDGRSILYLNHPGDVHRLNNLRDFSPDTNEDKAIADTSQFARFDRNADASVFVGASGSKASPYVLLLVRAAKRELTLAEHHASDPAMVTPLFSPSSQQVYFVSDRNGKPAIYAIRVEKMVERTDVG